jgi:hypothetical protein
MQADRGQRLIRDVEQQYPTHAHLPPDAPLPEPRASVTSVIA